VRVLWSLHKIDQGAYTVRYMQIQEFVDLKPLTTFGIGGTARWLVEASTREDVIEAITWAEEHCVRYVVFAGGSNVVFADTLDDLLAVRILTTGSISSTDDARPARVAVAAGEPLGNLVEYTLTHGLQGLEAMIGIPGTVGGAIVGNAAAYGQTISDYMTRIEIFDPVSASTYWISKDACIFTYRDSTFKTKPWIILHAEFVFPAGDTQVLKKKSVEILALRTKKYPPGLKCPGSFYRNLLVESVPDRVLAQIPNLKDFYGKVPAWYFLNAINARGMRYGGISIPDYHGNLLINDGTATYEQVITLVNDLRRRVRERFGVELEEEVRYIA